MLQSMILNKLLSSQQDIFQMSFIILILIKVTLDDTKGWYKNNRFQHRNPFLSQKIVCLHTKT